MNKEGFEQFSDKEQLELIETENDSLKQEIKDWKSDVEELQIEISHLKGRVRRLKKDMGYWEELFQST